ncbi:hypothetical protein BpHYR1_035170 [Brachionus plicatilis]|uniref:Uncharacterized protein n=1 Tax=Brachionus plicatilis TaxID=10195 RepID=A0A3M7SGK0_BRAPC|nr:hypothetical protein BpHYR1_035170 [Brachionus plicatilis]
MKNTLLQNRFPDKEKLCSFRDEDFFVKFLMEGGLKKKINLDIFPLYLFHIISLSPFRDEEAHYHLDMKRRLRKKSCSFSFDNLNLKKRRKLSTMPTLRLWKKFLSSLSPTKFLFGHLGTKCDLIKKINFNLGTNFSDCLISAHKLD